jgi:hypothetical protein
VVKALHYYRAWDGIVVKALHYYRAWDGIVVKALRYYRAWDGVVVKALHYYRAWDGVVVKATSWKVPGSIPGGVTGDFFYGIRQFHVPGSIQPLKMSTRILLGVKTTGM